MRRKDKEILDLHRMEEILRKCQVCRVGFANGNVPYVVPMSFGYARSGDAFTLYFHCAQEGRKIDCMRDNPNVAFEMDTGYEVIPSRITAKYECLMGHGTLSEVSGEEALAGLRAILRQSGMDEGYPIDKEESLPRVAVLKLQIAQMTAKASA